MGLRSPLIAAGALVLALLLALVPAGCGEEKMSADEFVASVEEQGVLLEISEDELITDDPDKDLYGLELVRYPEGKGKADAHGSLAAYEDGGGADTGMQACRASGDLLCYRAANIVVVLEGGGIEAQRLAAAIRRLGEQ